MTRQRNFSVIQQEVLPFLHELVPEPYFSPDNTLSEVMYQQGRRSVVREVEQMVLDNLGDQDQGSPQRGTIQALREGKLGLRRRSP